VTETTEVAYHEAGHAAALYALGFDLGDASVVPSDDHLGRMGTPIEEAVAERLDMLEYLGDDGQVFIVRQIAVAFAGVKAEEILTSREYDPRSPNLQTWLPGSDLYRLNMWLPMAAGPEEQTLVYNQAWDEAEHVLRENWEAVGTVAEALLEYKELDAAAVRSILEKAGCARDDAPIRRVYLEVQGDKLRERRQELRTEGDPENEMESLQEEIARINNELETMRREEKES
jgi:hypothetical protein